MAWSVHRKPVYGPMTVHYFRKKVNAEQSAEAARAYGGTATVHEVKENAEMRRVFEEDLYPHSYDEKGNYDPDNARTFRLAYVRARERGESQPSLEDYSAVRKGWRPFATRADLRRE